MPAPVSYLETVDEDGQPFMRDGVIENGSLLLRSYFTNQPLAGRGVRVYSRDVRVANGRINVRSLRRLQEHTLAAVRALLGDPAMEVVYAGVEGRPRGGRPHYVRMQARSGGHWSNLVIVDPQMIDTYLESWSRGGGEGEVLVEVDSTHDALEVIAQGLDEDSEAAESPRVAGPLPGTPLETEASAERRRELAADWLDAATVSQRLGSQASNASHMPNRLRRNGRLLGVWIVGEGRYRFPPWQLHRYNGRPIEAMRPILALLRGPLGLTKGQATSGWEEIEWFYGPDARLDGHAPFEVIQEDPGAVLRLAEEEFTEDRNARW